MAVRLHFEGIRCFFEPQEAVIRPITLLVGENSSGKTTFLALCRLAHAIAHGSVRNPPFNDPPFLLGAYDQIASYRGGRSGRGKSFSLTIRADSSSLRTEYLSLNGQPSPSVWRLEAEDLAIQATTNGGSQRGSILLEGPGGKNKITYGESLDFDAVTRSDPPQWKGAVVRQIESAGGYSEHRSFPRPTGILWDVDCGPSGASFSGGPMPSRRSVLVQSERTIRSARSLGLKGRMSRCFWPPCHARPSRGGGR
jgi:hypothetical protein